MAFLVIPTHASGIFNQIKLSLRFKIVFADTTLNLNKAEGNEAGLAHTYTTPLKKRNKKMFGTRRIDDAAKRSQHYCRTVTVSLSHLFFE